MANGIRAGFDLPSLHCVFAVHDEESPAPIRNLNQPPACPQIASTSSLR